MQLHSEKQLLMQEHRDELHRLRCVQRCDQHLPYPPSLQFAYHRCREELGRVKGKLATTQDQYVAAIQQLREARALLPQSTNRRQKGNEKELQVCVAV